MRKNGLKKLSLVLIAISMLALLLTACGSDKGSKWVGTYGGTSSSGNKVTITINKDGTAEYKKNNDSVTGTWTENENSISLDFGGAFSSKYEPLIVTLSSDGNTITVESDTKGWTADTYQRR